MGIALLLVGALFGRYGDGISSAEADSKTSINKEIHFIIHSDAITQRDELKAYLKNFSS